MAIVAIMDLIKHNKEHIETHQLNNVNYVYNNFIIKFKINTKYK